MAQEANTLEYTPTWIVALVCSVIVIISLFVERVLHYLGKSLIHHQQHALNAALQKLKEELMVLGFISLLLTVFQNMISNICIPASLSYHMLPCKRTSSASGEVTHYWNRRQILSGEGDRGHCTKKGKVPLLSIEALHHLHIFIFVLAAVHVIFCATTMVLGGAKISQWKQWETPKHSKREEAEAEHVAHHPHHLHLEFIKKHSEGFWRKSAVVSWVMSFFKQFYPSVTESDYIALRWGFIMTHCPSNLGFDFHKYMMRVLHTDFKRVVGISWYLWLFVVTFLLLNVNGWHTYFWLSFLPLILLLLVGAKLEHIMACMALDVVKKHVNALVPVKPSDEHFWFNKPRIVLYLIHFILFQNSFEIAFFFWILCTYGFDSCIMEEVEYIIPRLIFGVLIQVLCSYSTLPLYAIVTQMGSTFKREIFSDQMQAILQALAEGAKIKKETDQGSMWGTFGRKSDKNGPSGGIVQMQNMAVKAVGSSDNAGQAFDLEGITTTVAEHFDSR